MSLHLSDICVLYAEIKGCLAGRWQIVICSSVLIL